jgi:hypothetical protein
MVRPHAGAILRSANGMLEVAALSYARHATQGQPSESRRGKPYHGLCYHAGMSLFDPQQRWPERVMLVFGFVGIAVVSFAAGWLVGTTLKQWQWLGG